MLTDADTGNILYDTEVLKTVELVAYYTFTSSQITLIVLIRR